MGLAASMAQFLVSAGTPGRRYALPHARIQMPTQATITAAADVTSEAEQIAYLKSMLVERIASHTGQSVDRIEADAEQGKWFSAQEAKDYGIVDHVVEASALSDALGL